MDSLQNMIQPMNTTELMSQTTYHNGSILIPPTLLPNNQPWYMYGWEMKPIQLKHLIKFPPYNSFLNILEST
jgi:hypothetical protein